MGTFLNAELPTSLYFPSNMLVTLEIFLSINFYYLSVYLPLCGATNCGIIEEPNSLPKPSHRNIHTVV